MGLFGEGLGMLGKGLKKAVNVAEDFLPWTEEVTYIDEATNGVIKLAKYPDGRTTVIELEVPKEFRGKGVGKKLQAQAMSDNPNLSGQVSSKKAATSAYNLGRRPIDNPNASLEDVYAAIDDMSSVNMATPDAIKAFNGESSPSGLLDMSTPARMARAKEQGYNVDDVTYRWLSEDYPDNKLPTNSRYKFGDAIYSSPEPSYGQAYANEMSSNPVAYPMVARGKIANKDDAIRAEKILIEEGRKPKDYTQTMNAINQQLKTEGFTGLDYAGERMMFDEDTSRSIFAAFDPTKASSSNILASNPAALAGAGILGLGAAAQSNDTYADYSPSNLAKLRNDDVGGYQAPQSMAAANIAGLMGDANKVGYDDPLMGMVAPQLPSELMNKIAYNDERGLLDYAKAYAGLLGF